MKRKELWRILSYNIRGREVKESVRISLFGRYRVRAWKSVYSFFVLEGRIIQSTSRCYSLLEIIICKLCSFLQ